MKTLFAILASLFLLATGESKLLANEYVSTSATIQKFNTNKSQIFEIENMYDVRVIKLRNFLLRHKSPLAPYANIFVQSADKYNVDWRLVPAITGIESSFGKRIPHQSYNAYGWANGNYKFRSWEESIEHVTKTLREKYYDKGANTIEEIAKRYAPPSTTWSKNVRFFMNQIEPASTNTK